MFIRKGLIVSIQNMPTVTKDLALMSEPLGIAAVRTDYFCFKSKNIPIIGLVKDDVLDRTKDAYITPGLKEIIMVNKYTNFVAIDYRKINPRLEEISYYCASKNINVIADIGTIEDYENILRNNFYYSFIATTFNVFSKLPQRYLLRDILMKNPNERVIVEGGVTNPAEVYSFFEGGAHNVCIGDAIFNFRKKIKSLMEVHSYELQ